MGIIRMGVVGAGWIAREHRQVLDSVAEAELVAVCDLDRERAGELTVGTGARIYTDWRDLLDREDLGALLVCTPPRSHAEPAVAALSAGLPVYLEKPIARTPGEAAPIVAAAEHSGTVCAVGYQWHALDLLADLPGLLAGQQIGALARSMWWLPRSRRLPPPARLSRNHGRLCVGPMQVPARAPICCPASSPGRSASRSSACHW